MRYHEYGHYHGAPVAPDDSSAPTTDNVQTIQRTKRMEAIESLLHREGDIPDYAKPPGTNLSGIEVVSYWVNVFVPLEEGGFIKILENGVGNPEAELLRQGASKEALEAFKGLKDSGVLEELRVIAEIPETERPSWIKSVEDELNNEDLPSSESSESVLMEYTPMPTPISMEDTPTPTADRYQPQLSTNPQAQQPNVRDRDHAEGNKSTRDLFYKPRHCCGKKWECVTKTKGGSLKWKKKEWMDHYREVHLQACRNGNGEAFCPENRFGDTGDGTKLMAHLWETHMANLPCSNRTSPN
ncbi:hypothetical protein P280DRAFT_537907 [Massarina eburnea CBS 473.64]|uniref:Uncharacterized protein n=1 Tax=Massarina eburnea CBS 473.64 TaxID=1395130 RepID=A0A6A6SA93_9PLEO|nr:hypothetical protein P280DRAFT_537907 [Massarina eburnea CBS 473.64]